MAILEITSFRPFNVECSLMLSILTSPDSRPHPTLYNTLPHIMHTLLYIYGDTKSCHYTLPPYVW